MVELLKSKLRARRDVLLALDDMHIEIGEKHKPFMSEIDEELGLGVEGTFKKLQVDWVRPTRLFVSRYVYGQIFECVARNIRIKHYSSTCNMKYVRNKSNFIKFTVKT